MWTHGEPVVNMLCNEVNMWWTCGEHVVNMRWTGSEHVVNMWWTCGEHLWTFLEHYHDMFTTCCEHVVNMSWNVVNMAWKCCEHVVKMWWKCGEHVVNMSWTCREARGGKAHPHIIWPYIMFCGATSENLPNLVIYEIWRKNLNVSERRTDKVRFRGACFAPKKQEASSILRVVVKTTFPLIFPVKSEFVWP